MALLSAFALGRTVPILIGAVGETLVCQDRVVWWRKNWVRHFCSPWSLDPASWVSALLGNTIAAGMGLVALILMFGTISGAHFNPVVMLAEAWQKNLLASEVLPCIAMQILSTFAGVAAAHLIFSEPLFFASTHVHAGPSQWWGEFVATSGLIGVIIGCTRSRPSVTPFEVAAYITAPYWFTPST